MRPLCIRAGGPRLARPEAATSHPQWRQGLPPGTAVASDDEDLEALASTNDPCSLTTTHGHRTNTHAGMRRLYFISVKCVTI